MTEPRIASFRTLADLLTVQLAQTPGVETVERAELVAFCASSHRRHWLTARRGGRGRLLRADGFSSSRAPPRCGSTRRAWSRRRHGCQVMQMLTPPTRRDGDRGTHRRCRVGQAADSCGGG